MSADDGSKPGRVRRSDASAASFERNAETLQGSGTGARVVGLDATPERPSIGRYLVVREIGRGAMGRVLRAYDPKLHRVVALKVLGATRFGAHARTRLLAEAQAMARLSHPNVVAVFDVSVEEGADVVIAMELVEGSTLEAWLAARPRTYTEIIEVYIAAGRGLAAAHEAGLLHRDFKPANVMVSEASLTDPRAAVKVTDFGLALDASQDPRASSSSSSFRPLVRVGGTEHGQVVGTPRYMAPEQHGAEALGPAADQFAYCVALWQALTGGVPFPALTPTELATQKFEGPPSWPGGREGIRVPGRVVQALRRGLSVDAAERWPSMGALVRELERPGRGRAGWILGGVVLLGAVAVAAGSPSGPAPCSGAAERLSPIWNESARQTLQSHLRSAETSFSADLAHHVIDRIDRYGARWVEAHTEACAATTVRRELSSAVLDRRMTCLERARTGFEAAVTTLQQIDAAHLRDAHRTLEVLPDLSRCIQIDLPPGDEETPPRVDVPAVAEARRRLATAETLRRMRSTGPARRALEDAERAAREVTWGPLRAQLLLERGEIEREEGDLPHAMSSLREAGSVAMRNHQTPVAATAFTQLAFILGFMQADTEEARAYLRVVEGLLEGRADLSYQRAHHDFVFAAIARNELDLATAEAVARRAVDTIRISVDGTDIRLARTHTLLANILADLGRVEEAEREYAVAMEILTASLGRAHPDVGELHMNLGGLYADIGDHGRATFHHEAAYEILRDADALDDIVKAALLGNMAFDHAHTSEHHRAAGMMREAIEAAERGLGPDHPNLASLYGRFAAILRQEGNLDEAEAMVDRAMRQLADSLASGHPGLYPLLFAAAENCVARGDFPCATQRYRQALTLAEQAWGPDHARSQELRDKLAALEAGSGQ